MHGLAPCVACSTTRCKRASATHSTSRTHTGTAASESSCANCSARSRDATVARTSPYRSITARAPRRRSGAGAALWRRDGSIRLRQLHQEFISVSDSPPSRTVHQVAVICRFVLLGTQKNERRRISERKRGLSVVLFAIVPEHATTGTLPEGLVHSGPKSKPNLGPNGEFVSLRVCELITSIEVNYIFSMLKS